MPGNGLLQWLLDFLKGTAPEPQEPVGGKPDPVVRKVQTIIFNPSIPSEGGRKLSEVMGWGDPRQLMQQYIANLQLASGGYILYQVVKIQEVDGFPAKIDGFTYTGDGYIQCLRADTGFHQPDGVDYSRLIQDHQLNTGIRSGDFDEVWLFGFPYAGFYESRMVGPGAFFCNSDPIITSEPTRRYVIMGFNYQRGVGEMLESFGHRVEFIMDRVYRNMPESKNLFKRFSRYDKTTPGQAEVGSIHFAPNSQRDYDWGNTSLVWSRCDNWMKFPDLSGPPRQVNSSEWGNGDIRLHHVWYLDHLPRITGKIDGVACNWWQYVVDPNKV